MPTAAPPEIDQQQLITSAIENLTAIATLPQVTSQIISTVEDPRSSAAQLHKIVSHDPALVSRIMKVVNSSFYGLPGQIASIERAIVLLGLNAVKNLAVAASVGEMFRGAKIGANFSAKDLWKHCIAVAVVARQLAREAKLPIADEAFLAGMIHDIGLLVSLQTWPAKLAEVCEAAQSGGDFLVLEQRLIGVDHQALGAALTLKWKFPHSCQLVAGHHHDPSSLADNSKRLVTLVFTADTLCCEAGCGFSLTARQQKPDLVECGAIGLDEALLRRVQENLPALLESASGLI